MGAVAAVGGEALAGTNGNVVRRRGSQPATRKADRRTDAPELGASTGRDIRDAVVHSVLAADGIVVIGDTIHFYQVKELTQAMEPRLFGRLTEEHRRDFAELNPGSDPRQVFTEFVDRIALTHDDKDHLRNAFEVVSNSLADRAVWVTHPQAMSKLLLTQTIVDSRHDPPVAVEEWTEERNARRCQLIDQKIQQSLTPQEAIELQGLQQQAMAYRALDCSDPQSRSRSRLR